MITINTKYLKDQEAKIITGHYNTGSTALQLVSPDGEPLLTATVNIPQMILNPDQVLIKDYSENQGILDELIRLNIVSPPEFYVTSGFVNIPVCTLNPETEWKNERSKA